MGSQGIIVAYDSVIEDKDGNLITIPADSVVSCIGLRPNPSMREDLMYAGIEVFEVGDGAGIGNIRTVISDAYEIARNL